MSDGGDVLTWEHEIQQARAALAEAGVTLRERESVAGGIRRLAVRVNDRQRWPTAEEAEDTWGGVP